MRAAVAKCGRQRHAWSATIPRVGAVGTSAPSRQGARDRRGEAAHAGLVEGAVFRSADQALTYKGRLIHTTVRFLGLVLLGLALLSIRGRGKR